MSRKPNCSCTVCGKTIYRRPVEIARGPVYCSQACFGIGCQKPQLCPVCGKEFIGNRTGRKTCSRTCANISRTGIKYRQTSQVKKDKAEEIRAVKKRLIEERGSRCERCGYSDSNILVVHHIMRRSDGGTNDLNNLQLVCPNCHAEIHFYEVKHYLKGQLST